MVSKEIGILGERVAEKYLKDKGYQILDKNYSNKFVSGPQRGEIDIIAKKNDIISFIEAKTLINNERGQTSSISPEEKVDFVKQRKIIKVAESWLMKKKIPFDTKWQIDVIAVQINQETQKAKIRHFQNAIS